MSSAGSILIIGLNYVNQYLSVLNYATMLWIKNPKQQLTLPDWLSLYRIIAVPLLVVLLISGNRIWFGSFLLISFLTDAADGMLARMMGTVSQRGAQLDSMGDAITFLVGLIGILHFETDFILANIPLLASAFGLYFVQLSMAYWRYGMPSSFHTYLAKLAAIIQATFMIWLFFFGVEAWLFYLTIAISVMETLEEIALIVILPKWKSDVKGLFWIPSKKLI